jgi:hypothetical protein
VHREGLTFMTFAGRWATPTLVCSASRVAERVAMFSRCRSMSGRDCSTSTSFIGLHHDNVDSELAADAIRTT